MSLKIVSPNTVYLGSAEAPSDGQPIIINLDYMQDTEPSNPQEKDVWYNTSNDELYTYKNGQWIESDPSVGVWYKFNNQYYLWDGDSLEVTDLNIYEKIENKTDDYTEYSSIKYPSSKALSDGYIRKPTIVTDGDNTGLAVAGNTIYDFMSSSALTSLTISSFENSYYESYIIFKTGAGTIQFTAPNTLRWGGGNEQPQLEPNTVYCIAIRNGLAEIDSFGSAS